MSERLQAISSETMGGDGPAALPAAASSDLGRAVGACDFPVFVWELPEATLLLANDAAAQLIGRPLNSLAGLSIADVISPYGALWENIAMLASAAVDAVNGPREVLVLDGPPVAARAWSRALDLEDDRLVATLLVPLGDVARLGRDISMPWRELAPIAVGRTDLEWVIQCVTRDIEPMVGRSSLAWVGLSLADAVHPDDRKLVESAGAEAATLVRSVGHIRFRHANKSWIDVCLLVAFRDHPKPHIAFGIVGAPPPVSDQSDRVAELERRLRQIAAEVRAAGVIEEISSLPSSSEFPQLRELTTRQWEILSRLLRGERVPAIAAQLYLSQSTVRNHLTSIFQKFGAHSQSELLYLLRRAPGE